MLPLVEDVLGGVGCLCGGVGTGAQGIQVVHTFGSGLVAVQSGSSLSVCDVCLGQAEQEEVGIGEGSVATGSAVGLEVGELSHSIAVLEVAGIALLVVEGTGCRSIVAVKTKAAEECTVVAGSILHVVGLGVLNLSGYAVGEELQHQILAGTVAAPGLTSTVGGYTVVGVAVHIAVVGAGNQIK